MRPNTQGISRSAPLCVLLLLALTPLAGTAQAGVTVLGTLTDADSDAPVGSAIVTLVGVVSTMSTPDGAFRFRGIAAGEYTLRVEGFGYETLEQQVDLTTDVTLALALEAAPLAIDGIVVEAGTLDFEGRVRDPVRDFTVVDAEIVMDGREPIWTDARGRFDLDRVPEGAPLHLTVRAFGYFPIDTTFVPDDEGRYDFDLQRDAFAEAMVQVQVRRLEERAGGRLTSAFGVMDRSEILRYSGSHTAATMLEFDLPQRIRDRIICLFVDERHVDAGPSSRAELRNAVLGHTLPEEIERVEVLVFDSAVGRPIMLRVYTRTFLMAMTTQEIPLRQPTVTPTGECL